jgi:hypothetical protein
LTDRGPSNVVTCREPDSQIPANHNNICFSTPDIRSTNHRVEKVESHNYDTQQSPNTRRKENIPYFADTNSPTAYRHHIGTSNQATMFGNSQPSQNSYQQYANNQQSQLVTPQHNPSTQQFQIMQHQHVPNTHYYQMTVTQQYRNGQPSMITEHQRFLNTYQRIPGSCSQSPPYLTTQGQITPRQVLNLPQSDKSQMAVSQTTYPPQKSLHQSDKTSYSSTDQAFPTPHQPTSYQNRTEIENSQFQQSQISPLNNHQSSFTEASSHQPQNDLQRTTLHDHDMSNCTSQTFSVTGPPAMTYKPPSFSMPVQNPNIPYVLNIHPVINPVQAMSSMRTDMDNHNYNPPLPVANNPGSPICQAQMSGIPSCNSGSGPSDLPYMNNSWENN